MLTNKKNIKESFIFSLLFGFNIAFKELYRLFEARDIVIEGSIALVYFSLALWFVFEKKYKELLFGFLFFFYFLFFFSLGSADVSYGFQKAFLGIVAPILCFVAFTRIKWNVSNLNKYLTFVILMITFVGIIYKLKAGFFKRDVSYGLLGSITFGWVSGMAFLSVLFDEKKTKLNFLLLIYFFLMILWSGSKGPLVSVLLIVFFFSTKIFFKSVKQFFLISVSTIILLYFVYIFSEEIRSVRMIISFIENPEEYASGSGRGSIGTRAEYLKYSIKHFVNSPIFGVGFGGWNSNNLYSTHKYPHNLIYELLSETGIIGFSLFVLLIKKVLIKKNLFGVIGIYSLVSLQFSGDFSYFRYAFYPLLISYYINKNK